MSGFHDNDIAVIDHCIDHRFTLYFQGKKILSALARWPTLLSPEAMIVAILFSSAIGIGFGFYPAWRASRLDPIECLRYE